MTHEIFKAHIEQIAAKIRALPADKQPAMLEMLRETIARHGEIRDNIAAARDALDDWRIALKYRVFDLEAQAREMRPN